MADYKIYPDAPEGTVYSTSLSSKHMSFRYAETQHVSFQNNTASMPVAATAYLPFNFYKMEF